MSGLSDEDRATLRAAVIFADGEAVGLDLIAIERLIEARVNEALTEAATEIVSWERLLREAGNNGGPFMGANRAAEDAYQRAARIVRARIH